MSTQELLNGFSEFKREYYNDGAALMSKLVNDGQSPKLFIISCIDSRANPGTIFKARPGTFFAHKAMGAIVRPYKQGTALSAALQFALTYNEVDTIVVMGHTQCGAIQALTEDLKDDEITSFINVKTHALTKAQLCCHLDDDLAARTEKEVVLESVRNLRSYPAVAKALKENRVVIKPWLFDMQAGDLLEYNEASRDFDIVTLDEKPEDSRHNA